MGQLASLLSRVRSWALEESVWSSGSLSGALPSVKLTLRFCRPENTFSGELQL